MIDSSTESAFAMRGEAFFFLPDSRSVIGRKTLLYSVLYSGESRYVITRPQIKGLRILPRLPSALPIIGR